MRDFAFYWTARTVSFLGDGVMLVALPWQVYELSNSPSAMALVGAIQSASIFAFVLFGGVASDRFERKRVIIVADLARAAAAGVVGALALAGSLELWHLGLLVVVFGVAQGFAGPAFGSIVPTIVPDHMLVQANSALFTVNPLALRFVGPALGGLIIAVAGTGAAFLVDGASFLLGAITIALVSSRPAARALEGATRTIVQDIREAVGYVRGRAWLWGTFAWMLVALPFTHAPYVVLLPYLIKNELGGDAQTLGLVFAAGGIGSIVASLVISQVRVPRRHTAFMYAMFAFGVLDLFLYALTSAPWQAMAIAFVAECMLTAGMVVWNTLLQKAVPGEMLGRVRSLDWLAAFGLTPLGFVLMGPLSDALGVRGAMAACGLVGSALTVAVFLIPGIRQLEGKVSVSGV